MVDSALVLKGQTIAYSCYCLAIMLVMTVGVEGVIGIFKPTKNKNKDLLPAA